MAHAFCVGLLRQRCKRALAGPVCMLVLSPMLFCLRCMMRACARSGGQDQSMTLCHHVPMQATYINVPKTGPFKPAHYRY